MTTLFDTSTYSASFLKILENRGLSDPAEIEKYIEADLAQLNDPFLMKGMDEAVKRLEAAKQNGETVLIHGDYDVDGVTGATLLSRTLKQFGVKIKVFLPDRKIDGYGVSLRAIEKAPEQGVRIFMTCDCGITAKAQINRAKELGLEVIVIDHHRIPEDGVPNADIILNPLQEDCPYPFKDLSAAGLAFKLSQALLGDEAFEYLDLATLSTIGDVAPLKQENRVIVKNGLKALGQRKKPGIAALAKVSCIKTRAMNVGHVGFMIGPRINAAGRMSTPEIAYQLLATDHAREAESLANVLNEENKERQKEERATVKQAIAEVERTFNFNKDRVIVVGKQGWHAGVIGIVASRLVDRFQRPALVIAFEGEKGKASARSIKGFHLYNALAASQEHLEEFGGHEQAAGFSILETNLKKFRKKINEHANETYSKDDFVYKVKYDLEIGLDQISSRFARELSLMEPHGAGNSRPTFLTKNLKIKGRPTKKYGNSYDFFVQDDVFTYQASWKDKAESGLFESIPRDATYELYYSIKSKTWDGIESLSLDVKDIKITQS